MPIPSLRMDEQQLLDMAARARAHGCKRGYLHKADSSKLKKFNMRWCCVFHNFLFYFESESVPKPLGVIFLEGTSTRAVDRIGVPPREVEGTFCISTLTNGESSTAKTYYFMATTDKERDSWVQVLTNANMMKLQHDLDEVNEKCVWLEGQMATRLSEIEHLRRENNQAQLQIIQLNKVMEIESPRRPSASFNYSSTSTPPPQNTKEDEYARVLQRYIRGWLMRRRWKRVITQYLASPQAGLMRKRNQLIWKFVASEEDYVSQLTVLTHEYKKQCEISAQSRKPPLSLEQCTTLFRNCEELLLFHQLFLRGLHARIEKWPVVVFGDVLKLFIPMMTIYHHYIGNHTLAYDLLLSLMTENGFKSFIDNVQKHPTCHNMSLDTVLTAPVKKIETYIQDLQELRSTTPAEHVDYDKLQDTITQLENIQNTVSDEVNQGETVRQVLKIENMIEGGCEVLLDKEQILVRQGVLHQLRNEEKSRSPTRTLGKLRTQPRYCFLFSKHLIITSRIQKKPQDLYKIVKVVTLGNCSISEVKTTDPPEVYYRGIRVSCQQSGEEIDSLILITNSINEKAMWLADFSQCVENEKHNKILQFQSIGEPVELSSRFIRYSTVKTGKEQLVNCGNLESLLERLVKVSHYGLDFLNTFLMTFHLYTSAHTVLDFLEQSFKDCLKSRERRRSGSITPEVAVRDAREIQAVSIPRCTTAIMPSGYNGGKSVGNHLTIPHANGVTVMEPVPHTRTASESSMQLNPSITGIFFAVKHWLSKHFYHFKEDPELASKLENLLDEACKCPLLTVNEKNAALEASSMYSMQKTAMHDPSEVSNLMEPKSPVHLPQKPFECLLLWCPKETAEQLCLIESDLFGRITNSEFLCYFKAKGDDKSKMAPNLNTIFNHFNRMSRLFMWSIANQRYFVDRTKVLEFLIEVTTECNNYGNYSSVMQLMSALEHGAIQRFKQVWETVSKEHKQQFRVLKKLVATDGRFKDLRIATKKAIPPKVPYLGIVLNELSGVVESQPNVNDEGLINFTKMRKCTRLITEVLQYQEDHYPFTFIPEISKVLLCTTLPGDEEHLYKYVDQIKEK